MMRKAENETHQNRLWKETIRAARRQVQDGEQRLAEEETQLLKMLAQVWAPVQRDTAVASVEQALRQKEVAFEATLRQLAIRYHNAHLDQAIRQLDTALTATDQWWQSFADSVEELRQHIERSPKVSARAAREAQSSVEAVDAPAAWSAFANFQERSQALDRYRQKLEDQQLVGQWVLQFGHTLRPYQRRKYYRRLLFQVIHLLIFLGLFTLLMDVALVRVELYWQQLLAVDELLWLHMVGVTVLWCAEEYLLGPVIRDQLARWNIRALQRTVRSFYRAQRQALYLSALLEQRLTASESTAE